MPEITYNGTHVKIGQNWATTPFLLRTNISSIASPSEGGTYDVSVLTHPLNPWTAADSCTWLSIIDGSGTGNGSFSVVVDERATGDASTLSGRVTVSSRARDVSINITQVPIPDSITITPNYVIIGKMGATEPVGIIHSYIAGAASPWTATVTVGEAWLSINNESGNWEDTIYVSAVENLTGDCRYGEIEVSCGSASVNAAINQDGVIPC